RLNRFIELSVTSVISLSFVEIILVADFDVRQGERRGMPVFRTDCAPFRIRSAGHILDLIQRVLHVGFEIRAWLHYLSTERVTSIHGKKRPHTQVFTPVEEFKQAHSVCRVIAPGGRMSR